MDFFFSPVLKFPRLPFKFLTICCACLQNVVNVLLQDYFFSFEQTHTNAALLSSQLGERVTGTLQ